MTTFCTTKGIQQRFSAPYAQWMDHTAERNMRTIGEMAVTTLVHANLPKTAWGHAVLHASEVINRTAESADINNKAGVKLNFSRLEKWVGHELPGQVKGLYAFGCLCFKNIPPALRTKLDSHASPAVYLGLDPKSRTFLLGSLYDLVVSTWVEVTFVENVFPFRKIKHSDSPASLLWGTENNLAEGDARLGMFQSPDTSGVLKVLDRQVLKTIGALPPTTEPGGESFPAADEIKVAPSPANTPRRSTRVTQPPAEHQFYDRIPWEDHPTSVDHSKPETVLLAFTQSELLTITPKSAEQALRTKSADQWREAMNREKQCHLKNGTFGEEWPGPANPSPLDGSSKSNIAELPSKSKICFQNSSKLVS